MKFWKYLPVLLLLSGCTTGLTLVESYSETRYSESTLFQLDEKNDLHWLISNDMENIYVRLYTPKRTTQTKIMRAGLHLYYDIGGEKSEDTYLNFPVFEERQMMDREGMGRQPREPRQPGTRPRFDINRMIERVNPEVVFVKNDEKESFNLKQDKSDITVELSGDTSNVLHYFASVPLSRIFPDDTRGADKLSVGIVSGAFEIPVNTGGGMPAGREMPGGNQRMAEMQKRMAEMAEPVKIWALIKLTKE